MYSQISLIKKLCALGERQLAQEIKASKLLMSELEKYKVKYSVQYFQTKVPMIKSAVLFADRRKVAAKGTCFVSGEIKNKFKLINTAGKLPEEDIININYNPACAGISQGDFYFVPSLAINKRDASRVRRSRYVEGEIKVSPQKHRSLNILVGNIKNPKNILFAHYDSIGPGALDNASGIAVLMRLIVDYPKLDQDNLFVLAGNEELSYDQPYYWGRGYRAFENKYSEPLKKSEKILIVDGIGCSKPLINRKKNMINSYFPLKNMKKYFKKIRVLTSSNEIINKIYHSDLDTAENIKSSFLNQANRRILKLLD